MSYPRYRADGAVIGRQDQSVLTADGRRRSSCAAGWRSGATPSFDAIVAIAPSRRLGHKHLHISNPGRPTRSPGNGSIDGRSQGQWLETRADVGICSTVRGDQNAPMDSEKFEAIGPRGEACIILMRRSPSPNGQTVETYTLATGDKLRPTDVPGEFTTLSGNRTFRLRDRH